MLIPLHKKIQLKKDVSVERSPCSIGWQVLQWNQWLYLQNPREDCPAFGWDSCCWLRNHPCWSHTSRIIRLFQSQIISIHRNQGSKQSICDTDFNKARACKELTLKKGEKRLSEMLICFISRILGYPKNRSLKNFNQFLKHKVAECQIQNHCSQ